MTSPDSPKGPEREARPDLRQTVFEALWKAFEDEGGRFAPGTAERLTDAAVKPISSELERFVGARSATSEATPVQHVVDIEFLGKGAGRAHCRTCGQRSGDGTSPYVLHWKDQHEADTLVPQLQVNSKFEQNLDEGLRPSGSEAEPADELHELDVLAYRTGLTRSLANDGRSFERIAAALKLAAAVLVPGCGRLDWCDACNRHVPHGVRSDAAQAARSEATPQIVCAEDCPAEDPECRCHEQTWHRTCCHVPAVAATEAEPSVSVRYEPGMELGEDGRGRRLHIDPEPNFVAQPMDPSDIVEPGVSGEADTSPRPRVWAPGSLEPDESVTEVIAENGVVFARTSRGLWLAKPPVGNGRDYAWAWINEHLTVAEVLPEGGQQ